MANSLIHRSWNINSNIRIAMYDDRIEIIFPGKLPEGLSKEEFLKNNISILKEPIIANVFFRLNIIEKFGTGIERIRTEYENNILKPEFEINENTIIFKLPIVKRELDNLNIEELEIYKILKSEKKLTRLELEAITKFNKSKIIRIINSLISKNVIDKTGKGRLIAYKIK